MTFGSHGVVGRRPKRKENGYVKAFGIIKNTTMATAELKFNLDEPDERMEFKRCSKANDMASFIWELVHNGWRDFKNTDYDYQVAWDKIQELLEEHHIDINDLA